VELDYTYDKDSNRTKMLDGRPGASQDNRDMVYTYDGLDRLQEAERGAPGSGGTFSHAPGSRQWDLDMLGNWSKIFTDASGDGDYSGGDTGEEHRRGHNDVNEILGIDTDADGTDELDLAHDDNGNLREQDLTTSPSATAYRYTHDLWNRLVRVEHVTDPGGTETLVTKGEYEYFGTHWRSIKTSDSDDSGGIDEKREQYYTAGWQLVEERIDDSWSSGGGFSADRYMQYLWGTRYIDDIIMHREDTGGDGDFDAIGDQSWWHLTDVQFSTVAVLNDNAVLQERIAYDPYGRALHHDDKDVDGDRDFDQDDRDIIDTIVNGGGANIEDAAYNVDADLDRDGAIDSTDQSTANNAGDVSALATGELSNATVKNAIGWDGYVFNPECGLYHVRFRCYSPSLGRWLERDPKRYIDGMNQYDYVDNNPLLHIDPDGTKLIVVGDESFMKEVLNALKWWCPDEGAMSFNKIKDEKGQWEIEVTVPANGWNPTTQDSNRMKKGAKPAL